MKRPKFDLVYRWKKYRPELAGQRCRLLARGTMNSALVQFENGTRHIVSRNALRKVKNNEPNPLPARLASRPQPDAITGPQQVQGDELRPRSG